VSVVTGLQVQKRNKERVNVYLDDEYAFSLTLVEAAKLRKGQTLSDDEIATLRDVDAVNRAVDTAARFLANRPRSTSEIRRNLAKKDTPEAVIDRAVARLEAMGYIDDTAFARYWLENRNTFKPRGPMALRYELRQKGVPNSIIDQVLEEGLDVENAAYQAANQKASRLRGLTQQQFRHKLGGFLQRRGFTYATSRDVIEQIATERAEEDPEFFAADPDDWG